MEAAHLFTITILIPNDYQHSSSRRVHLLAISCCATDDESESVLLHTLSLSRLEKRCPKWQYTMLFVCLPACLSV